MRYVIPDQFNPHQYQYLLDSFKIILPFSVCLKGNLKTRVPKGFLTTADTIAEDLSAFSQEKATIGVLGE